jgi:small subunit ribosomal protein S16
MVEPNDIKVEKEKVQKWMDRGATPTETVRSLLKKSGYFDQA